MTADKLADAILNKCDIYYGGALISKEAIIEKYLAFFAKSLVSKERTINFALHTGSVCFDVISVVAVALGCLSYNLSTNDDIISSLQPNDMVLFKGQRYRWKGTGFEYGSLCMILQQDGKGKNGKTIEDGTHYKITFHDPRYMFTVSKTPGDHREGKNLISDICKAIDISWKI